MAMEFSIESVVIKVPNSEACTYAQIKGIKDSTVGGYYIQDDLEKKKVFLDFFDDFKLDFYININSLKKYVNDIKSKIFSSRFLFKGELETLQIDYKKIVEANGIIPRMEYTGENGRYLSFDNTDKVVEAFRNIILGDISKLIIEKYHDKFLISLVLTDDYMFKLYKKVDIRDSQQLSQILKSHYEDNKELGVSVFGFDYSHVIIKNNFSIEELVSNAGISKFYAKDISRGVELRTYVNNRNYYIDSLLDDNFGKKKELMMKLVYNTNVDNKGFKHNRIIFGAPGTGKSFNLNQDKDVLIDCKDNYERVTFHPDYSYAQFVGSYKPVSVFNEINNKKEIEYKYVPGPFMRILVEALKSGRTVNPKAYLLLIEEINRANVAAVFGEVFQLLDRKNGCSEYTIQTSEDMRCFLVEELGGVLDSYSEIKIPDNMFIWATMNSADQGVFPMDTAFKRRWDFTYLGINESEEGMKNRIVTLIGKQYRWNNIRKAINDSLIEMSINEDKLLGPYFINMDSIETDNNFDEVFKNKVLMYLYEDAGRQRRTKIFKDTKQTFSSICEQYDLKKLNIFMQNILDKLDEYEKNMQDEYK